MIKYCLAILGLFLLLATAARAEIHDFDGIFSADVPEQWGYEIIGERLICLNNEDASCSIEIFVRKYVDVPDLPRLAHEYAGNWGTLETLRVLPENQGYIYVAEGSNVWLTTMEQWVVAIKISASNPQVPAIMASLQANPDYLFLNQAFNAARNVPEIRRWLYFEEKEPVGAIPTPLPAPLMPNFTTFGAFAGQEQYPAFAELPAGWTGKTLGQWAVMISDDRAHWAAVRYCPLAPGDVGKHIGSPLLESARMVAKELGGRNISSDEGSIFMNTPAGQLILEWDESQGRGVITILSDSEAGVAFWDSK